MKTLVKTIAATALIVSFVAPSYAAVEDDVISAAGTNGHVNVQVSGDTVTLTGFVEDSYAKHRAETVAAREGFEVENYLILAD